MWMKYVGMKLFLYPKPQQGLCDSQTADKHYDYTVIH